MFNFSNHSYRRSAQRNLSSDQIDYIIQHGKRFHRNGVVIYYLRCCDIPFEDQANDNFTRLVGTAVILSWDERTLITVWRNRRKGLKIIRRKPFYCTEPRIW